jgi:HSP20 family protein
MFVRVQRHPITSSLFSPLVDWNDGDSLFDDLLTGIARPASVFPAIDMAEYENESVLVAEMPGVRKEDLKLSVNDGVLTISGERRGHKLPENSSWLRNEIESGKFTRSVQLPHDVNADGISAELTNGVLRVVLPKAEEIRPREIKVQ